MSYPKPTLIQVCAFLKRNNPSMRLWRRDQLVPFVEWYWRDARIGIVRAGGKIIGVAMARVVNKPEDAGEPFVHDEKGKILWVQDIVAKDTAAIGQLLKIAAERFGLKAWVAGHVFSRNGELRMLPWVFIERFIERTSDGNRRTSTTGGA